MADTGPMLASWDERTAPTVTALCRLRDETNRALNDVQVGGDVPQALRDAWDALNAAQQRGARCR